MSANQSESQLYTIFTVSWGVMGFVCCGGRLLHLWLPRNSSGSSAIEAEIMRQYPQARYVSGLMVGLKNNITRYFAGNSNVEFNDVDVELGWAPVFTRRVLQYCRRIRPGETISYAQLARSVNNPRASRAVGTALRRNRTPLIIPCHRVIASDGTLGGFSAGQGTDTKARLLAHETQINGL